MKVFETIAEWRSYRAQLPTTLGFVPTMGALHPGHASLVERSVRENEKTIVSIFVNPTQFDDPKDLEKYPRTREADLTLLEKSGASYALLPRSFAELYPDHYRFKVTENERSKTLCGAHRPGHFDGVLTVVLKLLGAVQAERAYFGEKDYQQLTLIREMAEAFFLPTQIVPCPTVREADGLAMSSRNTRLPPADRARAPVFTRLLSDFRATPAEVRARLESEGFAVDYIEEVDGRRYGAVKLGSVRLIDNFPVVSRKE